MGRGSGRASGETDSVASRVLVVDDRPEIHDDFRRVLGAREIDPEQAELERFLFGESGSDSPVLDVEIDSAFQGEEATDLVRTAVEADRPYAVAFVDVRMPPGIDGIETIRRIWEIDPAIQVVVCSAYSDYSWEDFHRTIGSTDRLLILQKPFEALEVRQLAFALSAKWKLENDLRRARDEAEAANRIKDQFLANMSHEIRTPLSGVMGVADLLLETPLTPDQRQLASTIRASADTLAQLVDEILDFSKLEQQMVELECRPFALRDGLEHVGELLGGRATQQGVELVVDVDPSLPVVEGDEARLRQVLSNLAGNAIKFTHDGEVVISADEVRRSGDAITVRFAVRDTGIGISESARETIFAPFRQADASTTRRYGGTGLGLAISRRLVERMGGEIRLESKPREGSRFWFDLEFPMRSGGSSASAGGPTARGRRFVIVEPNDCTRRALRRMLEHRGAAVVDAADVDVALAEWERAAGGGSPYDAVVVGSTAPADADRLRDSGRVPVLSLVRGGAGGRPGHDRLFKPVRLQSLVEGLARLIGPSAPPPDSTEPTPTLVGVRALVVEDNAVNQLVARRALESMGSTVQLASDGHEAIEAVATGSFDIVLMDCQMPGMDGYEATGHIRNEEKGTGARLPIIALTAHALPGDRQKCIDAGMDDYVVKPFDRAQLLETVRHWTIGEADTPATAPTGEPEPRAEVRREPSERAEP